MPLKAILKMTGSEANGPQSSARNPSVFPCSLPPRNAFTAPNVSAAMEASNRSNLDAGCGHFALHLSGKRFCNLANLPSDK